MQDNLNELDELKSLLINDEVNRAEEYKPDNEEIIKNVEPLLERLVSKKLSKETMIDSLYPIMGSMIAKYVSNAIQEMMEKINRKIEDGLSLGSYKRKMKSKVSGVSETELLLKESYSARIRSFFIIDKESSLLIAEEHLDNQEINDPHMVASMASAIKDFVNDWIANHKENAEVQLLSYGNETLYIESAGSVYLIAFLNAEPDHKERREIQQLFAKIVKKHYTFFQSFDGDDSQNELLEIKSLMQEFLNHQIELNLPETKKKSNFVKYSLYILFVLCIIYMGFLITNKYNIYQLEQHILNTTGEHITIEEHDNIIHVHGFVKNIEKYEEIENALHNNMHNKFVNEIYLSPKAIEKKYIEQIDKLETELLNIKKRMYTIEKKY